MQFRESDLNQALNSLYEGVCYLSSQGEVQYYNSAALAHWQSDRLHTGKITSQSSAARALAGERVYHELVHLDHERDLLVSALPMFNSTNVISGVMVISQDVSEHVALEQESHTALNVLLEATIDTFQLEDLDKVLRRIAELISQLEAVDNSIAFRLDDATGILTPVALFGTSQQSFEEWQSELAAIQLSTEQTIQQPSIAYLQAIRLGRTFMVDFKADSRHSNPRNLLAAIYAPVFLHGRVAGLLGAERHRPLEKAVSYFPQWSVDLLTALARLASVS
ncbi:MAG TPA: GAF domain-containing protein, partial [Ktedonobacteraceae bacterium]|nr:GAF domain-containing protein [Ktedonobacteraceae bacterium]